MLLIVVALLQMTMVIAVPKQVFSIDNQLAIKTAVRCVSCPLLIPKSLSKKSHVRHRKGHSTLTTKTSLEYEIIKIKFLNLNI